MALVPVDVADMGDTGEGMPWCMATLALMGDGFETVWLRPWADVEGATAMCPGGAESILITVVGFVLASDGRRDPSSEVKLDEWVSRC